MIHGFYAASCKGQTTGEMVITDKFKVSFADSNGRSASLELCCFCQNVTDLTQTPGEVVQTILSSAQTVDGWKILTKQQ